MLKKIIMGLLMVLFLAAVVEGVYVSLSVSSSLTPSVIEPGDKANLILTISNAGTDYAKDIELYIKTHNFITIADRTLELPNLRDGGSTQVIIPMEISKDAPEGTTALSFMIRYTEGAPGTGQIMESAVSIPVTKRTFIQIKNVSYDKKLIQPGDTVLMTIRLQNVGRGKVNDLIVSLKNLTAPFIPTESDVEDYLGILEPTLEKIASFNLIINRDASTTGYSIPVTVTYYDKDGVLHTEQKYVGIKISGKPEFVIVVEETQGMYAEKQGEITISIANRGTATAEFLTVRPIEPGVEPKEVYIGTVDPDEYETFSLKVDLAGIGTGKQKLNMYIIYKDPYNQESNESRVVEFTVTEPPPEVPLSIQVILILVVVIVVWWGRKIVNRLLRKK